MALTEYFMLPEGADPSADKGRAVAELFLEYRWPPNHIAVQALEAGRFACEARWDDEREFAERRA